MADISFDYGGVGGAVAESPYLDNGLGESLGGVAGAAHAPLDLPDNTLLDGLSEHWDFDETTGNRAGSEGNYDLVPTGTVSYVTGKISNAVDFGGGRIEVTPSSPALHGALFTLAFWYKPDSATPSANETLAAISNSTVTTSWWLQHLTDGTLRFRVGDGVSLKDVDTGPAVLDTTKFNLIICQFSDAGDFSRIRVNDGGWIYNLTNTLTMQTPVRDLSVGGSDTGGGAVNGAIDEMAIWPALKSDADIAWLWNGGAAYGYAAWLSGSTTTTITPTGVDVIAEASSPVRDLALVINGLDVVVEAASPSIDTAPVITGADVIVEAGAPIVEAAVQPIGADVIVEAGTPVADQLLQPAGLDVVAETGSPAVIASTNITPTGLGVIVEAAPPSIDTAPAITGADVIVEAGTPVADQLLQPAGMNVILESGSPTVIASLIIEPTGVETIVESTTPIILLEASPAGAQGIVEAGTPNVTASLAVAGVDVVVNAGTPVVLGSTTLAPTGFALIVEVSSPGIAAEHSPTGADVVVEAGDARTLAAIGVSGSDVVLTIGSPTIGVSVRPGGVDVVVDAATGVLLAITQPNGARVVIEAGTPVVSSSAVDVSTYRETLLKQYEPFLYSNEYDSRRTDDYESVLLSGDV